MSAPALLAKDVTVRAGGRVIVDRVGLRVEAGEWLAVIGPNGAGKSTLLRAIAGVVDADGEIEIEGTPLSSLPVRRRAQLLAVVAQNPTIPEGIDVASYVALGRTPHRGVLGAPHPGDAATVAAALATLGITSLGGRIVDTLSGGERQRVLLARAIAQDTPVLLLDEPTTALDVGHQQEVLELVDRLRRERGLAVLMTIHDLTLAARYPDRLLLLVDGREQVTGTAAEVLTEAHLARFYDAQVSVLHLDDGIVVVPRRPYAAAQPDQEPDP